MTSKENDKHVKFDLASNDDRKSEVDNDIRNEMHLEEHQTLVSKIYKLHWEEGTERQTADVVVPVDVPEVYQTYPDRCTFYLTFKSEGVWDKTLCSHPTDGCVRGNLKEVDAFAALLETVPHVNDVECQSTERMTVGPDGGTFVSEKDPRVTVDFPEGAVDHQTHFYFQSMLVDTERFEEYQKLSEDFKCIEGFTNILGMSPEVQLKRPAKICLPLEGCAKGTDSNVVFIHWKKTDCDAPKVMEDRPHEKPNNCYCVDVSTIRTYAPVYVNKKASPETITHSVEYISGRKSLCNILSFLFYDQQHEMHLLLADCVDFFKVDRTVELHKLDGMEEIAKSRSRDIELRNKTRIKMSFEGNLTLFEKRVKVNSMLYNACARTNKVSVPVKNSGIGAISVIRYSWHKDVHQVHFFLETKSTVSPPKESTQSRPTHSNNVKPLTKTKSSKSLASCGSSETRTASSADGKIHSRTDLNASKHSLDQASGKPPNKSDNSIGSRCVKTTSTNNGVGKSRHSSRSTPFSDHEEIHCKTCQLRSHSGLCHSRSMYTNGSISKDTSRGSCHSGSSSRTNSSVRLDPMEPSATLVKHNAGHPLLSEKSLSALGHSLPESVWRFVGIELNLTNDFVSSIYERSEKMCSDPRFEMLKAWKYRSSKRHEELLEELLNALEELGRSDIARVLVHVSSLNRNLRRTDFDPYRPGRDERDVYVPTQRVGQFIYPV